MSLICTLPTISRNYIRGKVHILILLYYGSMTNMFVEISAVHCSPKSNVPTSIALPL